MKLNKIMHRDVQIIGSEESLRNARLRAITPLVVQSVAQFRNPEDRELILSGLRLAAGEGT
jgi:hypothetical protein